MGRRKIEIQPITHERNRSVTFLKRKNGLFKKAYELGVLCSVDVAVIIFEDRPGHGVKLYQYGSGDIDRIVQRHMRFDGEKDFKGPGDFSGNAGGKGDDAEEDDIDEEDEPPAKPVRPSASPKKNNSGGRRSQKSEDSMSIDMEYDNPRETMKLPQAPLPPMGISPPNHSTLPISGERLSASHKRPRLHSVDHGPPSPPIAGGSYYPPRSAYGHGLPHEHMPSPYQYAPPHMYNSFDFPIPGSQRGRRPPPSYEVYAHLLRQQQQTHQNPVDVFAAFLDAEEQRYRDGIIPAGMNLPPSGMGLPPNFAAMAGAGVEWPTHLNSLLSGGSGGGSGAGIGGRIDEGNWLDFLANGSGSQQTQGLSTPLPPLTPSQPPSVNGDQEPEERQSKKKRSRSVENANKKPGESSMRESTSTEEKEGEEVDEIDNENENEDPKVEDEE